MRRQLTEADVEFSIECDPDHVPIRGNCSAINPEIDREAERWIRRQLERGNQWAWCCAVVRARWEGFEGWDSLGCCSYESEESFRQPGGYYDDMKVNALAHLNEVVEQAGTCLDQLEVSP